MIGETSMPVGQRVAVLNHSAQILTLFRVNLEARGYEVFTFLQQSAFIEEVEVVEPDLIVLGNTAGAVDDDFAVVRQFRQRARSRRVPIIIATPEEDRVNHLVQEFGLSGVYVIPQTNIDRFVRTVALALSSPDTGA